MDSPDKDGEASPVTSLDDENRNISPMKCEAPAEGGDPGNEMDWMERIFGLEEGNPYTYGDAELETQVLNYDGETQMDEDGEESTQLVDDEFSFDADEGSDGTENLCVAYTGQDDQLSDDESSRKSTALTCDGRCESGTASQFTSVQAASLRVAGVVTQEAASVKNDSPCILTKSSMELEEPHKNDLVEQEVQVVDITDNELGTVGYDDETERIETEDKSVHDSSTVPKIFTGALIDSSLCFPCGSNVAVSTEGAQKISDDRLRELTYVYSQEPGEASQANALDCVQKIIDHSKDLLVDEGESLKTSKEKVLCNSAGKGLQNLAKKAGEKGNDRRRVCAFDWDDRFEDEEGGEFFSRNKAEFFGSTLKLTGDSVSKRRRSNLSVKKALDLGHSELAVNGKTSEKTETKLIGNLVERFYKEMKSDVAIEKLEIISAEQDKHELLNVGVNTQMAVEAIEALSKGDGIFDHNNANGFQCQRIDTVALEGLSVPATGVDHSPSTSMALSSKSDAKSSKFSVRSSKKNADNLTPEKLLTAVKCKSSRVTSDSDEGSISRTTNADKRSRYRGQKSSSRSKSTKYIVDRGRITGGDINVSPVAWRTRLSMTSFSHTPPEHINSRSQEKHEMNKVIGSDAETSPLSILTDRRSSNEENEACTGNLPVFTSTKMNVNVRRNEDRELSSMSSKKALNLENSRFKRTAASSRQTRNNSICLEFPSISKNLNEQVLVSDEMNLRKQVGVDCMPQSNESVLQSKYSHVIGASVNDMESVSPLDSMSPEKVGSPVYVRAGYTRVSPKNSSKSTINQELRNLLTTNQEQVSTPNNSRKRRELVNVKVLFSQHLDDDVLKQQKKIVERLNISVASSISDATHFIADQFMRTRNMLEAIAGGKPIVTHLWLEDVGQANYYIDEQKYILQDGKKEKEFGFKLSVSLAHARHNHLLQDRKVLITPNVKPSQEIVSTLVKAVHGQAVKRVGRSFLKESYNLDHLLILSCEDDYESCITFLERGAAVYSSELLLDGIVTQKLEYERHRLFSDNFKRTRGTVWFKRDGSIFVPVKKK